MLEYLSANMWQVWAVVAVLGLILELSSGDFFIICFSIGALFAALAAAFGLGVWIQLAAFALFTLVCPVITLLSIFLVRPFALRYLHRGEDNRVSNADAIVNRCGRVTEDIPEGGFGRVAIDGDSWKAKSVDGKAIAKDEAVQVRAIESTILTVNHIYLQQ